MADKNYSLIFIFIGITGVRPTDTLKLGRTKFAGYRAMMQFYVGGQDCQAKAHAVANALIKRIENELVRREMGEFTRKTIHTTPPLGVEGATECFLRAVVRHDDKDALKFFGLEVATAGTSMAPGLQAGVGGRPKELIYMIFLTVVLFTANVCGIFFVVNEFKGLSCP